MKGLLESLIIFLLLISILQIIFRGGGNNNSTKFIRRFSKLIKNLYFD